MTARLDPAAAAEVMRAAGLEPLVPYPGSNKPWQCRCTRCGAEVSPQYTAIRYRGRNGCRFCAGQAVDPDAAVQIMRSAYLEPLTPYPGANLHWPSRCTRCGEEVTPRLSTVKGGGGCKFCASKSLLLDATAAADVMRAAGLEPLVPYPGAGKPWPCRCVRCGEDVSPHYDTVTGRGAGCRRCANSDRAARARASVAETRTAAMRKAGLEPLVLYPGHNRPWLCRCGDCGAEVSPSYASIQRGRSGCRFCIRKAVGPVAAVEVMRRAGLEPLVPYPGGNKGWLCRCLECGAEVTPRYNNTKRAQRGCRFCAGKAVDADRAADQMQAAGLEPLTPFPGASTPWRCRCRACGAEVTPTYDGTVHRGHGCRFCAGKAVDPEAAVEVMRRAGLEPLVPYPGNHKGWLCRCLKCGAEVAPHFSGVKDGSSGGCRVCAGVGPLDPQVAVEVMRGAALEPMTPYPGNRDLWPCRCLICGATVTPRFHNVRRGFGGCRSCAWNLSKPGRSMGLYVMTHPLLDAVKVGVGVLTDTTMKRVDVHQSHGWHLHAQWIGVKDARVALAVERQVLERWRTLGIRGFLRPDQMPQAGASETAPLHAVNLDDLVREITLAITDYSDEYAAMDDGVNPEDLAA